MRVKFNWRNPFAIFGLVLLWRVALLAFTAQPIPANDSFGYDGAVIHFLNGGNYCNPSLATVFPISGTEVYSMYPPGYQIALLAWMKIFGCSVLSVMTLHLVLFALAGAVVLMMVRQFFPPAISYVPAVLLFFGFTFGDRPESLAYVFGLAGLWSLMRQGTSANVPFHGVMMTGILLLALFTSPIVGAYFFGVGFVFTALLWLRQKQVKTFIPFFAAGILFMLAVLLVAKFQPRWWAGFMESAAQQSVVSNGFHIPTAIDLFKFARTAPVFVLALLFVPLALRQRKTWLNSSEVWPWMVIAVFLVGWGMVVASLTILAPNYVSFVMFTQVLLAVGLLAMARQYLPKMETVLRIALFVCVLGVSVRGIGLTTWGAACASKNSYADTRAILQAELKPFTTNNAPVLIGSAFLYQAAEIGVRNPVHCDWYYDHAHWTNGATFAAMSRLQPTKLVLTQFDYYRSFEPLVGELKQATNLVSVTVRDFAKVRTPDSMPSLQRVVQHLSWAPVIVDLEWKAP